MVGGFVGKKLEVDLTTKTTKTTPVTDDEIKTWVGAKALAVKWLWDRCKRGTDPLSPDSPLFIVNGPLTGLPPMGGINHSISKSPLTGGVGEGTSNGFFGSELKYAGYDAIIFTGKAASPVYLYIKDDVVELRDAKDLWGKGPTEAVTMLNEKLWGESNGRRDYFCCLAIGIAGENLVSMGIPSQGAYHNNSHGGTGAVMGSKNLKAIAVRGTKPIPLANKEEYFKLCDEWVEWAKANAQRTTYLQRRWAALSDLINCYNASENVQNEREVDGPQYDQKTHIASDSKIVMNLRHNAWRDGCRNCWLGCGANTQHKWVIRSGKYAGTFSQGKSDNLGSIGTQCLFTDADGRLYLAALADELGMNGVDVGITLSWAMECYEKGILSKADLGGIEMKWGDIDASAKLMMKIARREGIGNKIAEGPRFFEKNWPGSGKYAMVAQGTGQGASQKSFRPKSRIAGYTASGSGPCYGGLGFQLQDANGYCILPPLMLAGSPSEMKLWKAATGFNLYQTPEERDKFVLKARIMERCFNIREGRVPLRDEVLPDRIFEPVTYGHGLDAWNKGLLTKKEEFPGLMQKLYADLGCDTKGYPTRDTLKNLGLDFVTPVFEEMKVWG